MTDKKPTDEEIIKALQCCSAPFNDCAGCPLYGDYPSCECERYTIDLINRQQDEIVSLKTDLKRVCAERDAYICTNSFIKTEAYKEFAERLTSIGKQDGAYGLVSVFEIAKLLKEMVGKEE